MTRRSVRRGERGSVFIESIVAAAIIAMILAATFQVVASSAGRGRMNEARRAAALVARSQLAAVGVQIPLQPGEQTGASGGLVWRAVITPYQEQQGPSAAGDLLDVKIDVSSREGAAPLVELRTLRLAKADRP